MKLKTATAHIRNGNGSKVARLPKNEQARLFAEWERTRYRGDAASAFMKLVALLVLGASPWWGPLLPGVSEKEAAIMHSMLFAVPVIGASLVMAVLVVLFFWPRHPATPRNALTATSACDQAADQPSDKVPASTGHQIH